MGVERSSGCVISAHASEHSEDCQAFDTEGVRILHRHVPYAQTYTALSSNRIAERLPPPIR